MKKLICIILALSALLLCACDEAGNTSVNGNDSSAPEDSQQSAPPQQSEPAEESINSEPEESRLPPEKLYENTYVDENGTFCSNYECGIDIEVRWTMQTQQDGTVLFTADVYLRSYSVKVSARYNNCILSVNGEETLFSTPNVNVEDPKTPEYTYLATVQTEVEVSDEVHDYVISLSFPFRGTYNDVSLPVIEATESFTVMPDGSIVY